MKYFRHGDVTVQSVSDTPTDLKEVETSKVILALGEVTGHAHAVLPIGDAKVSILTKDGQTPKPIDEDIVFRVKGGKALLIHEEHEPIVLEEGTYNRKMKVQFNPFKGAIENVRD